MENKNVLDYEFTKEELNDYVSINELPREDLPLLKSSIETKIAKMDKNVAILKGVSAVSTFVFIGCAFGFASTLLMKNPETANLVRLLTLTNGIPAFICANICKTRQHKIGKNRAMECTLYSGVSSEYERRKKQESQFDIEYHIED